MEMIQNLWSDAEATEYISRYQNPDLALRIYGSRLLGQEPRLVLHGGGNTSVKTTEPDLFGIETEVLRIKGSGWDLAAIEPVGLPAVRLEPLLKLAQQDPTRYPLDRKSTRLNSSHTVISYAVFCLKKKIKVEAPTVEEAVQILKDLRPKYESHHKAKLTDDALKATVRLSDRYITDRFLPHKTIDVT